MAKKSMLQFIASWMPGEKEEADANCSVSGMIQVTNGGTPTAQPAAIIVRDYVGNKPCWWPAVTVPGKKVLSYGPSFAGDEFQDCDLHQVKIAKDSTFTIKAKDGTKTVYRIEKVEDLTA
jgi:hypothetical protein